MARITDPSFRLADQPHHQHEIHLPTSPKLGLHLGSFVKPVLRLADYIDRATAQPPAAVSRPHPGFSWGMLANDQLGDCVIAMVLHSIMSFHLDAGTTPPAFTDQDAISLYGICGYKPGDPSTDGGCDESAVMQAWENGLAQTSDGVSHTIAGTVAIDPTDLVEMRVGIDEFGAVSLGVALPVTAQGQTEWDVVGDPQKDPNSQPGSWGGHGIPAREYDQASFSVVTWGSEILETVLFHQTYMQEAHVVVTQEMLNAAGQGPSNVAWADLESDLSKLAPVQQGENQ